MKEMIKLVNLEYMLIKPYWKAVLLTLLVPVAFVFANRSLITSVSFAMCLMAMSSNYTFSVIEKNNMDRFYVILPVNKMKMVISKYCFIAFVGVFTLLFSLIVHCIVLAVINVPLQRTEMFIAVLTGLLMYVVYISFQIPGYYKYGAIKGRTFMYIPVIGFLAILFLGEKNDLTIPESMLGLLNNVYFLVGMVIVLCVLLCSISIFCSYKIELKKKL